MVRTSDPFSVLGCFSFRNCHLFNSPLGETHSHVLSELLNPGKLLPAQAVLNTVTWELNIKEMYFMDLRSKINGNFAEDPRLSKQADVSVPAM